MKRAAVSLSSSRITRGALALARWGAARWGAALRCAAMWGVILCCAALSAGCDPEEPRPCSGERLEGEPRLVFGGERPVEILLPPDYDPTCPTPLLLLLHGYSASGALESLYFDAEAFSTREVVIVAAPDGTRDDRDNAFWNSGGEYCCPYWNLAVDDVAYLDGLIDEISVEYNVDPERIYVVGHSNGAMMAYRLACEIGHRLAAVATLAGPTVFDMGSCEAAVTSVLHLHGDADDTVLYPGGDDLLGDGGPAYPGALASASQWATHNGCDDATALGEPLDLDNRIDGTETRTERWTGCPVEGQVELWTLAGAGHIPALTTRGLPEIWRWMAPRRRAP